MNTTAVFKLAHVDTKQVVLKVVTENNLVIAMNPYVNATYDYISVTRGDNHNLTIVFKDGHTYSFHWGTSGDTLVSQELQMLREAVCSFIESQGILLGLTTNKPTKAKIVFNPNFCCWQLTVDSGHYFSRTAKSIVDIQREAKRFVNVKGWVTQTAPTGVTVWVAMKPISLTEPKIRLT